MEENTNHDAKGEVKKDKPSPVWIKAGSAFAGGMAGGFGGALLLGGVPAIAAETDGEDDSEEIVEPVNDNSSPWTDGQVPVAHGVNDSMSFGQAFAAARAEVGAGGVFEWRGGVYGTFNAQEWNSMSAAERAEWSSHFNWSNVTREPEQTHHGSGSTGDNNHGHEDEEPKGGEGEKHPDTKKPDNKNGHDTNHDGEKHEYEVISVDTTEDGIVTAIVKTSDGKYCMLADTDGDGVFDTKVADTNGDGQVSDNEIVPLSPAERVTVEWASGQMGTEPPAPGPEIHEQHEYEIISVEEDDGKIIAMGFCDNRPCILIDGDGDGIFDLRIMYEKDGDIESQEGEYQLIDPSEHLTVDWAKSVATYCVPAEEEPTDIYDDDIIVAGEEEEDIIDGDDIIIGGEEEDIIPDDPYTDPTTFDDI
ncbi:MAG: hypothetical protein Q4C34_01670 [Bacteroidales bacterium]|nr:hypothetical protein [Bacteroidales bacterium]